MSDTQDTTGQATPVNDTVQAPEVKPSEAKASEVSSEEAFARRERKIRQEQKALQAERAKWEQDQKTRESEYKTKFVRRDQLENDTLGTLAEMGLTPEKLGQLLMEAPNQNDPTVRMLRAEMKAIKDAQEAQARAVEEQQTQAYQQALKQIGNEAKMLIDSDPEFETIKAEGLYDSVTELIEETWNTEQRLMDVREACAEVENYLVAQGLKFAGYGKVKAKLAPKPAEETAVASKPAPKQTAPTVQLKTLTNQMQTTPSKKSAEAEKRARAIAAFQGKLTS